MFSRTMSFSETFVIISSVVSHPLSRLPSARWEMLQQFVLHCCMYQFSMSSWHSNNWFVVATRASAMSNFFRTSSLGTIQRGPRRDGTFEIGTLAQFKRQKKVKVAPLSLILLFITTPSRLPVGFHDLTLRWRVKNLFYILCRAGQVQTME